MLAQRPVPSSEGRRIVICDYNALLLSVTGLLRMSGYCVFQAYDAMAARELCGQLPNIEMLILNTTGTGVDSATLVRDIRESHPPYPCSTSATASWTGCRPTCRPGRVLHCPAAPDDRGRPLGRAGDCNAGRLTAPACLTP